MKDTTIIESTTARETLDTINRLQSDVKVYNALLSELGQLSTRQMDRPEVKQIQNSLQDLLDDTTKESASIKDINDKQLELIVNTEQGVKPISIEFSTNKKYDFNDSFQKAKKECLGSQRVGPSYMHRKGCIFRVINFRGIIVFEKLPFSRG